MESMARELWETGCAINGGYTWALKMFEWSLFFVRTADSTVVEELAGTWFSYLTISDSKASETNGYCHCQRQVMEWWAALLIGSAWVQIPALYSVRKIIRNRIRRTLKELLRQKVKCRKHHFSMQETSHNATGNKLTSTACKASFGKENGQKEVILQDVVLSKFVRTYSRKAISSKGLKTFNRVKKFIHQRGNVWIKALLKAVSLHDIIELCVELESDAQICHHVEPIPSSFLVKNSNLLKKLATFLLKIDSHRHRSSDDEKRIYLESPSCKLDFRQSKEMSVDLVDVDEVSPSLSNPEQCPKKNHNGKGSRVSLVSTVGKEKERDLLYKKPTTGMNLSFIKGSSESKSKTNRKAVEVLDKFTFKCDDVPDLQNVKLNVNEELECSSVTPVSIRKVSKQCVSSVSSSAKGNSQFAGTSARSQKSGMPKIIEGQSMHLEDTSCTNKFLQASKTSHEPSCKVVSDPSKVINRGSVKMDAPHTNSFSNEDWSPSWFVETSSKLPIGCNTNPAIGKSFSISEHLTNSQVGSSSKTANPSCVSESIIQCAKVSEVPVIDANKARESDAVQLVNYPAKCKEQESKDVQIMYTQSESHSQKRKIRDTEESVESVSKKRIFNLPHPHLYHEEPRSFEVDHHNIKDTIRNIIEKLELAKDIGRQKTVVGNTPNEAAIQGEEVMDGNLEHLEASSIVESNFDLGIITSSPKTKAMTIHNDGFREDGEASELNFLNDLNDLSGLPDLNDKKYPDMNESEESFILPSLEDFTGLRYRSQNNWNPQTSSCPLNLTENAREKQTASECVTTNLSTILGFESQYDVRCQTAKGDSTPKLPKNKERTYTRIHPFSHAHNSNRWSCKNLLNGNKLICMRLEKGHTNMNPKCIDLSLVLEHTESTSIVGSVALSLPDDYNITSSSANTNTSSSTSAVPLEGANACSSNSCFTVDASAYSNISGSNSCVAVEDGSADGSNSPVFRLTDVHDGDVDYPYRGFYSLPSRLPDNENSNCIRERELSLSPASFKSTAQSNDQIFLKPNTYMFKGRNKNTVLSQSTTGLYANKKSCSQAKSNMKSCQNENCESKKVLSPMPMTSQVSSIGMGPETQEIFKPQHHPMDLHSVKEENIMSTYLSLESPKKTKDILSDWEVIEEVSPMPKLEMHSNPSHLVRTRLNVTPGDLKGNNIKKDSTRTLRTLTFSVGRSDWSFYNSFGPPFSEPTKVSSTNAAGKKHRGTTRARKIIKLRAIRRKMNRKPKARKVLKF